MSVLSKADLNPGSELNQAYHLVAKDISQKKVDLSPAKKKIIVFHHVMLCYVTFYDSKHVSFFSKLSILNMAT